MSTNLWRIDGGGKVHLSLHPGQSRAWRSNLRFVFMVAGTQGGKTSFGPWWLWREIGRCGGGDYLAVTASFDLFKLKMLPEIRKVFCSTLGVGRWWAGERTVELKNPETGNFDAKRADDPMWARIILRSSRSDGGLESATAKAAWLDECGQDGFSLEDWQAVQRRLSLYQGRVLGTTTPYNIGWLKTEIRDPWANGEDEDIDYISFSSTVNPVFPQAEYDRMKRKMQGWRFRMFYDGQITRPAGLIYNCFTDEHLVDDFDIPDSWRRAVGVDFGGANTAILWAAEDQRDGVWYIYDEWLGGGMTSGDYADKAMSGIPQRARYDAWGGSSSEGQSRRDWRNAGFVLREPPVSGVEPQIDRGVQLFREKKVKVFKGLRGLRDELGSYKRVLGDDGTPTDKIEKKRHFHRLDAYRYMASGIVGRGGGWARGPAG